MGPGTKLHHDLLKIGKVVTDSGELGDIERGGGGKYCEESPSRLPLTHT